MPSIAFMWPVVWSLIGPVEAPRRETKMSDVINLCILIPSISVILRNQLKTLLNPKHQGRIIFLDSVIFTIPVLYGVTLGSNHQIKLTFFLVILYIGLVFLNHILRTNSIPSLEKVRIISNRYLNESFEGDLGYITGYRAFTLLSTCIAILAVDFNPTFFAIRLAKTVDYGLGYMDIGIGSLIISNALTSSTARGRTKKMTVVEKLSEAVNVLKYSWPILLMGLMRLLMVGNSKGISVKEYGLHWNFFITLFFVKVVGAVVLSFTSKRSRLLSGCLIIILYEILLKFGIEAYIMKYSRRSGWHLINANKEGIFSTIGHLGTYIIGTEIGRLLYPSAKRTRVTAIVKLAIFVLISVLLGVTFQYFDENLKKNGEYLLRQSYNLRELFCVDNAHSGESYDRIV